MEVDIPSYMMMLVFTLETVWLADLPIGRNFLPFKTKNKGAQPNLSLVLLILQAMIYIYLYIFRVYTWHTDVWRGGTGN